MDLSKYTALFRAEAREHIATVNRLLLHLERQPDDGAAVDELFRAVHTLKGTSAAMGYQRAAQMAHALEHVLDRVRLGTLQLEGELIDLLFQGVDVLEAEVGGALAGAAAAGGDAALLDRLLVDADPALAPGTPATEQPGDVDEALLAAADLPGPVFRVRVRLDADSPLPAARAVLVLRTARTLGTVATVSPAEEQIMAGECGHEVVLVMTADAGSEALSFSLASVGEVEDVQVEELAQGAPTAAVAAAGSSPGEEPVARVAQVRLDALVDSMGELVIARDRLGRLSSVHATPELAEAVEEVALLVSQLRDQVMAIRQVPIREVLDRMPRVVRDAARALDRSVALEVAGGDTELDRALLKELGDLLVHLLRNAVDHGIEPPAERLAAGKPEAGRVRLTASREPTAVVVRVEDDGRGLQRERILQRAAQRGMLDEVDGALSDDAVLRLITQPGFSTAERVTDVSGRGVGLDAVRSRVHALGGAMEVESEPGRGTAFTLRLPLTLSIIRVLQVEVLGEAYVIPVMAVAGVTEVGAGSAAALSGEADPLLGGDTPLLSLAELVAPGTGHAHPQPTPVVVMEAGHLRFGALVDVIHGQRDAVVKRFDAALGTLPIFSGATLLSDGRPSLIVDAERLAGIAAAAPVRV